MGKKNTVKSQDNTTNTSVEPRLLSINGEIDKVKHFKVEDSSSPLSVKLSKLCLEMTYGATMTFTVAMRLKNIDNGNHNGYCQNGVIVFRI